MRYPFHDRRPGSWVEGANDGHRYLLLFRAPPDAATRARIAAAYERGLATGPANAAPEPWVWNDRAAQLAVGERWGHPQATFAHAGRVVDAIHAVAPLELAAFLGARESDDPVALPSGHFVADPMFEAQREAARGMLERERVERAAASTDGIELVQVEAPRNYWHPQLPPEVTAAFRVPEPRTAPNDRGQAVPEDGDHPVHTYPRPFGRRVAAGKTVGFVFLDDAGTRRDVTGLPEPLPSTYEPALHVSGQRALIQAGATLFEVDFATGAASPRWVSPDGAGGVGYFGDAWVVHTTKEVLVLDPSEDQVRTVASLKRKDAYFSLGIPDAVIVSYQWKKEVAFIGFAEGKLKKLATLKAPLTAQFVDGRLLLSGGDGTFEVRGLDELYETWAAAVRKRSRRR